MQLQTDAKKIDWLKNWLLVKNPQFLSNQADIQATSPTHELATLTKFHKDWQEIVDFLVIAKSLARSIYFFFASVSTTSTTTTTNTCTCDTTQLTTDLAAVKTTADAACAKVSNFLNQLWQGQVKRKDLVCLFV